MYKIEGDGNSPSVYSVWDIGWRLLGWVSGIGYVLT